MKHNVVHVYQLEKTVDDPRFEGFALTNSPSILGRNSLDEDVTPGFGEAEENAYWQQPRLLSLWVPPRVIGRVSEFNDYPCVDMVLPAFSQRAVEGLRQLLEANGELLALDSDTQSQCFLYNILTISDALDVSHSHCDFWCDPPTTATTIDHFAFHKDKLSELSIFRICQLPISVFVTDEFVDRASLLDLKGLTFTKVWPLPPGVNWRTQDVRSQEQDRKFLKRNTLVLAFPFEGTVDQQEKMSVFEDQIDRHLKITALDQPYFGSYEGHDHKEHEYRMFFSTPDADSLYRLLQGQVDSLRWPAPVRVYRRYGHIFDANAREVMNII